MRVYFHFNQSKQAYICHNMALYWQKRHGWKDFGGLIIIKEGDHDSYLYNQKEINYRRFDIVDEIEKKAINYQFEEDEVDQWERRLDMPLWNLAIADRYIGHWFVRSGNLVNTDISEQANHELIQRYVCYYLNYFEKSLTEFRPDFVFFPAMASMHSLSLLKMCELLKIPYYIYRLTRIKDRGFISPNSIYERSLAIEEGFNNFDLKKVNGVQLPEDVQSYLDSFTGEHPQRPTWHGRVAKSIRSVREKSLLNFYRDIAVGFISACLRVIRNRDQSKRHVRYKHQFSNFLYNTRINLARRYFNENRFDKVDIGSEKYVFYPLHMDPEATTMILAPHLTDQRVVVDQLSVNIPLSHKLYVKEHHSMLGRRPKGFYQLLKKNPNIKLLSPFEDTFALIRNASLVTVITGTVGWESILMGKPVLVLGRCFFSNLRLVENCYDLSRLSQKMKQLVYSKIDQNERYSACRYLLSLIMKNSFHIPDSFFWGDVSRPDDMDEDKLEIIAEMCRNVEEEHQRHLSEPEGTGGLG